MCSQQHHPWGREGSTWRRAWPTTHPQEGFRRVSPRRPEPRSWVALQSGPKLRQGRKISIFRIQNPCWGGGSGGGGVRRASICPSECTLGGGCAKGILKSLWQPDPVSVAQVLTRGPVFWEPCSFVLEGHGSCPASNTVTVVAYSPKLLILHTKVLLRNFNVT